jgi:RHS repeat-associated protein
MFFSAASNRMNQNTSKERDAETGLDYFGARYYSGGQGRFMSIDPGPFTIADPQNWNRYSYVQNNPLKFIDPTGKILTLSGENANALIAELEEMTGLSLDYNNDTGVVSVSKHSKRRKAGSKNLANLITDITDDPKRNVRFKVGKDQPLVQVDSYLTQEIDLADILAIKQSAPELATALTGHALKEGYEREKLDPKANWWDNAVKAHSKGLEFESQVLSDFTGKNEKVRAKPVDDMNWKLIYTSVQYDVPWKTQSNASVDVTNVKKVK